MVYNCIGEISSSYSVFCVIGMLVTRPEAHKTHDCIQFGFTVDRLNEKL